MTCVNDGRDTYIDILYMTSMLLDGFAPSLIVKGRAGKHI